MGFMDKLRGELVDVLEWIDESRGHPGLAFPALQQRDQERRRTHCPRRSRVKLALFIGAIVLIVALIAIIVGAIN